MEPLYPDIQVKLVGEDGNAFFVIGSVRKALRRGGVDEEKSKSSSRKRLRAITTTSSVRRCGGSKSTSRQIPKRRSEPIHGWFLPAPSPVPAGVRRRRGERRPTEESGVSHFAPMQIPPSTVATPRRTSSRSGGLRQRAQDGVEVRRGRSGPCGAPQRRWERVPGVSEPMALPSMEFSRRAHRRRSRASHSGRYCMSCFVASTEPASPYATPRTIAVLRFSRHLRSMSADIQRTRTACRPDRVDCPSWNAGRSRIDKVTRSFFFAALLLAFAATAQGQELFQAATYGVERLEPEPSVVRSRSAVFDKNQLVDSLSDGSPLVLNLFPDARFEATVKETRQVSRGSSFVYAAIEDGGHATLFVAGGIVRGEVHSPHGVYTVSSPRCTRRFRAGSTATARRSSIRHRTPTR